MKWKTRACVLGTALIGGTVVGGLAWAAPPLPSATAGFGHSNGTGFGVPGVVTVSESDASTNGDESNTGSWSAVTVAGQSVIGRDGNNQWSGLLAALGPVIDSINSQTCASAPTDLPTGGQAYACVTVLPGAASSGQQEAGGAIVGGGAFLTEENDTPLNGLYGFEVFGSYAETGCRPYAYANIARVAFFNSLLGIQDHPVGQVEDEDACA